MKLSKKEKIKIILGGVLMSVGIACIVYSATRIAVEQSRFTIRLIGPDGIEIPKAVS